MIFMRKARLVFAGVVLLLLGIIVACGESATPAPTEAVDTQAIVADAVAAALAAAAAAGADVPTAAEIAAQVAAAGGGVTAEDVQAAIASALAAAAAGAVSTGDVQAAVAAALAALPTPAPGADVPSAAEIAAQVQAAVLASLPEGTSPAELQAAVAAAAEAAAASTAAGAITIEDVQTAIAAALAAVTPVATPVTTPAPSGMVPTGTLNVGVTAQGAAVFNIPDQGVQQSRYDNIVTHEDWWRGDSQGNLLPVLVREWSVSPDGLTYTFQLQEGVPFHHGWGDYSADDFIFSLDQIAVEGSIASSAGAYRALFFCDGCAITKINDLTVQISRPTPTVEIPWQGQRLNGQHSKLHFDTVGAEQANTESVGTGPFVLEELRQGQFRRASAVQDHWRKTPDWAELTMWEINEESTRLANFLTGLLDTATFTRDTIQAIKAEGRENVNYLVKSGGSYLHLIIYGQQYEPDHPLHLPGAGGEEAVRPLGEGVGYTLQCDDFAYVACDRDTTSAEWEKARKVREAMSISIDREKLVNNLAFGDGKPLYHNHWTGHDGRLAKHGLADLIHEYDPARARQLLVDAGFPDGFDIPMTLTEFGPAGPIAAGQAVANMWQDVGINAIQAFIPYPAWRPCTIARTCEGIATHINNNWVEPVRIMPSFYHPRNAFNLGFEHPDFTGFLDVALSTIDPELRWERVAALSLWAFENVLTLPLFERPDIWPLGPELGTFDVGPLQGVFLNNWEYAPHRE